MNIIKWVFLFFALSSCNKQEIIATTSTTGKVLSFYGTEFKDTAVKSFAVVNNKAGSPEINAPWEKLRLSTTQAMYEPTGRYSVTQPLIELKGTNNGKIFTRNNKTGLSTTYSANTPRPTTCMAYVPAQAQTYAVQEDTVIAFQFNEAAATISKTASYPSLQCGTDEFAKSSTAHGYLPYLYIAGGSVIRRLDLVAGTYTTVVLDAAGGKYYGIRYNLHDSMLYALRSFNGKVNLVQVNPVTNAVTQMVVVPNVADVFFEAYTVTIHCCENTYIFFQNKHFYNIDITKQTVQEVVTDKEFQGLIWVQD